MRYNEVENYCTENGYTSRASRYEIMSNYFGIGAGTIKDIISFDRYLRDILEVDQIGIQKEAEYHKSPALFAFENQSKQYLKDKLLYG